jgi:hypothetical protein
MTRLTPILLLALAGCSAGASTEPAEASRSGLTGSTYKLATQVSGKCLDVNHSGSADGTRLQEWTCNGTGAQSFRVEDAGGGSYRFVNPQSGKCVDVSGSGTADGTVVQLWTCNGTGAQSFRIESVANGYDRLVNTNSSKCVDVTGGASASGTAIELWTCNGTSAQAWKLMLLSAPPDAGGPADAGSAADSGDAAGVVDASDAASPPDASDAGPDASDAASSPDTSGGGDPYAAARQACVDHVNQLRASIGLSPFARWTANETCADGQCKSDSETGTPHGAFGQCPNWGQCECPGWGSVNDVVTGCLDAMWAEGPGGGHYDIMTSTSYTEVSCGFYVMANGMVWGVQDYR